MLIAQPFDRAAWETAASHELHVRIGNAAPVIGKAAGLAELEQFFSRITRIGSNFCETCRRRESLFSEMDVEFRDDAGEPRTIPCVIVVRVVNAAVLDVRFHLDPSPIPGRRVQQSRDGSGRA